MRNFIWNCFQVTGSVDAYLLYKDLEMDWSQFTKQPELEQGEEEPTLES